MRSRGMEERQKNQKESKVLNSKLLAEPKLKSSPKFQNAFHFFAIGCKSSY